MKSKFNIALLFGFLCVVFLSFANFNAACDDLRSNVLRLHIIANSDSVEDQELKLKIRDRILSESMDLFDNITNVEEAIEIAESKTDRFCEIANQVIAENGLSYQCSAEIGVSYFETREYENFTLPAGEYKSLIIRVGQASGKNWWCVIFPEICLPTASKTELSDVTADKSADIAEGSERYVMRFKAVEIYEEIKKLIKH